MTTTSKAPELHELATDPQAFDTLLADLTARMGDHMREIASMTSKLHVLAGDKRAYRNTQSPVWGLSDLEVKEQAQRAAVHGDAAAKLALTLRASEQAMLDAINFEIANMNAVYMRHANRWTRFFPSVTKSQPHIHRSLNCHTLHATTVMTWAPQLSGRTDEEAVAELDEALCSVCFPSAPVALHNYQSKRSQAERDDRDAAKAERARKLAVKNLAPAEVFRTRHGRDQVTTVAKCQEVIRAAVEAEVEVEFWATNGPAGWDADQIADRRRRVAESLVDARYDANTAAAILEAREAAHEGHGMTAQAIADMRARKLKSARKGWFR